MCVRGQGAPQVVDAGRSGRLACVAWRFPGARALPSPPVAPLSGRATARGGRPHPLGGRRLRGAGPASTLGVALPVETRPGVDHGIIAPAGSPVDLCARHGRFPAVEAALVRLTSFGARTVRGGDRVDRGTRRGSTGVEGASASPGLGRQRTVPGPRWTSSLVGSPARCAGGRVAGSAHPYRSTRVPGGVCRGTRAGRVRGDRHRRRPRVPVRAVVCRPDRRSARRGARVVEERRSRADWARGRGYPRERPRFLPALRGRGQPPDLPRWIRFLAIAPPGLVRAGMHHR